MSHAQLRVHWLAFRILRARVRIVAVTQSGEPIVRAGPDRLVLRHGTQKFWMVTVCSTCQNEMASADFESHECTAWSLPADLTALARAPVKVLQVSRAGTRGAVRMPSLHPAAETALDEAPERSLTRSRLRQARGVAKRTLGRRISILGLNSEYELLAVVDDVRLTLPAGARHFRVVSGCVYCGTEVRVRVMQPDDLIDGGRQICIACSREGSRSRGR